MAKHMSYSQESDGASTTSHDEEAAWFAKVKDLAQRGLKLGHVLGFYQSLVEGTLYGDDGRQLMVHFDPKKHTTSDVVRAAIIPVSKVTPYGSCAYSTLAEANKPVLATVMVSHHWRNLFCHLVAALISYALGETSYASTVAALEEKDFEGLRHQLDRRDALHMTFWLCLFCVNQHASICGSLPSAPVVNAESQDEHAKAVEYHHRETHDPVTGQQFEVCGCGATKHWNNSTLCEMVAWTCDSHTCALMQIWGVFSSYIS